MEEFRIEFVQLESGNIPFEKFLSSLTKNERAEILAIMEELRIKLNEHSIITNNISKHLRDGIFELRVKYINKISRSLYFYQFGKLIVFTHGFIKKTQSVPSSEIDRAIKYRKIYLENK